MELVILGAGQYGQLAKEIAESLGYTVKFLDDNYNACNNIKGLLSDWQNYNCSFFVAIGDSSIRLKWLDRLEEAGKQIATLISKQAYVSPSAKLGVGTIIEPLAAVSTGSVIGNGVIICAGAVINHNSFVGDGCQIDGNATVTARSNLPAGLKINAGTVWRETVCTPVKYDFDAVM